MGLPGASRCSAEEPREKASYPAGSPGRLRLRSPTVGVMGMFSRSTAEPCRFAGGNVVKKQSWALDLGLGGGVPPFFHPSSSPRDPCSSSKKERGLNICSVPEEEDI